MTHRRDVAISSIGCGVVVGVLIYIQTQNLLATALGALGILGIALLLMSRRISSDTKKLPTHRQGRRFAIRLSLLGLVLLAVGIASGSLWLATVVVIGYALFWLLLVVLSQRFR